MWPFTKKKKVETVLAATETPVKIEVNKVPAGGDAVAVQRARKIKQYIELGNHSEADARAEEFFALYDVRLISADSCDRFIEGKLVNAGTSS